MTARRFALPALALSAAIAFAGCGNDTEPSQQPAGESHQGHANESEKAQTGASPTDVEFAQMMIPHHAQAIEMAEMVPDQGVSKELTRLADDIEAAQQPEIEQLTEMLERWGADVPATDGGESGSDQGHGGHGGESEGQGHEMEGMMSEQDMASLGKADGREFERMWLTMMVEHHEGAVTMSEAVLQKGEDAEARKLARQIIDAQDREIGQMNRMLDKLGS